MIHCTIPYLPIPWATILTTILQTKIHHSCMTAGAIAARLLILAKTLANNWVICEYFDPTLVIVIADDNFRHYFPMVNSIY